MLDLYREIILDHYKHPRNFGSLDNPDSQFEAQNASCGDKIRMEIIINVKSDRKIIKDVRFSGVGCAISIASASMLTEKVKGMEISEIKKITADEIQDWLGTKLTPSRIKCATLPLEVLTQLLAKS
jgi:nitrogen fixation protein NifU and related proteins